MNELYRDKLQVILGDEILLSALKVVFGETIEKVKPIIGTTDDNALLGEKYRAYETAKQILEQGFIDLLSYKIIRKSDKQFNKER